MGKERSETATVGNSFKVCFSKEKEINVGSLNRGGRCIGDHCTILSTPLYV